MPFSCFGFPPVSWVKGKSCHTLKRLEEDRPSGAFNESRFHKWRLKLNPCPASRKSSSPSTRSRYLLPTEGRTVPTVSSLLSFVFVVSVLYGSEVDTVTTCDDLRVGTVSVITKRRASWRAKKKNGSVPRSSRRVAEADSSSWKEEQETRELIFRAGVRGIGDCLILTRC